MGATTENDHCPHCGSTKCSASCYYQGHSDGDEDEVVSTAPQVKMGVMGCAFFENKKV